MSQQKILVKLVKVEYAKLKDIMEIVVGCVV